MKKIVLKILLVIGVLTMNIEAVPTETNSSDLTWFEFEESPMLYRFAIVPQQPILIGFKGKNGEKGETLLIKQRDEPKLYKKIVLNVDRVLQKHKIKMLKMERPKESFSKESILNPSTHLRFAYSDNSRWSAMYDKDKIPSEIKDFVKELKFFAKEVMSHTTDKSMSGEEALASLKEDSVIKIKVLNSNEILLNNHSCSFTELNKALDEAKEQNVVVLYSRESPLKEPSKQVGQTVDSVIEAIMKRGLKLRMVE